MARSRIGSAALYAVYEYLLVVVPVGLYVFVHGLHEKSLAIACANSPEWNIATVFLLMHGQFLYHVYLESTGRKLSRAAMGIIALLSILGVVLAASNIHLALQEPSRRIVICMWWLFAIASVVFVMLVVSGRLVARNLGDDHE
jgi:hypothetical protein